MPIPSQVTVVAGAHSDASALSVLDTALNQAGARRINQVSDAAAPEPHALTVYVGGDSENAQTAAALSALGIAGPSGLPAQGYVLGVGRVQGGVNVTEVKATFPAGTTARYLRLVDTGTRSYWVVVNEFTVLTPPLLDVTGAPAAAGSSFAAAADGDLDTVYRGERPQPGDALTATLPAPTSLDSVIVAQSGSASADADVQVDVEGTRRTVGELTGGYTKVSLDGLEVSAIRLRWAPGSAAPAINDIIPVVASSSN